MGYYNYVVQYKLLAAALGIALGLTVKTFVPPSDVDQITRFIDLLMHWFQLLTAPLIVTSIIRGLSGPSFDTSSKIAVRANLYYVFTTCMSVSLGLVLVLLSKPWVIYTAGTGEAEDEEQFFTLHGLMDLLRNMFPDDMLQAYVQQYKTKCHKMNATEIVYVGGYVDETNILGLIVCSFLVGLNLKKIEGRGKFLVDIFTTTNKITKHMFNWTLCVLPFGVLSLIASRVVEVQDWDIVYSLGKFVAVVVIGLIIHGVIVLPAVYLVLVRRSPWAVIKGVSPALLAAVCNSSSFMLPNWTNVNKNGTALYEVMAAVLVCQVNNVTLNFCHIITIGVTTAVSTIGTVGLPATGAMTTFFVLSAVNLPANGACILVVVQWLLDRFNTTVNVLGNCIGVALVHHLSKNELEEMEEDNMDMDANQPGPS